MNQAHRIIMATVLAFSLSSVQANDLLKNSYITAHVGIAKSNVSTTEVQAEFNRTGSPATVTEVNDRRKGFGLGVGYSLGSNWAVELAYLDLEQVDIKFNSLQTVNNLEHIHPESGNGVTLSGLYLHPLSNMTNVRIRLGVFNWNADYDTTIVGSSQTGTDSDSGTDAYWGFGLDHKLTKNLQLTGEFQRFDFDRDNTDYVRFGVAWYID